jgi:hypothetical protein
MFGPRSQPVRILVRPGITDMRKAINGLSVLVEQEMELDPFEDGAVYRSGSTAKTTIWLLRRSVGGEND